MATQFATYNLIMRKTYEMAFEAMVQVNPFGLKKRSHKVYLRYAKKFAGELARVIRNDLRISFEIIQEILIRSFPARYVTDDQLVTSKDVEQMAEILSPNIINKDGLLTEDLFRLINEVPQST